MINLTNIRNGIFLMIIGTALVLFSHTIQCGRWDASCREILDKQAGFSYIGIIIFLVGGIILAMGFDKKD